MPLKRDQHKLFGRELRGLLQSKKKEDQRLYHYLSGVLDALTAIKRANQTFPGEERLDGKVRDVSKLPIKNYGYSVRLYWTIYGEILWMLALDVNKRRTAITKGMIETLYQRMTDVREDD